MKGPEVGAPLFPEKSPCRLYVPGPVTCDILFLGDEQGGRS